jgi:hypothetical protein
LLYLAHAAICPGSPRKGIFAGGTAGAPARRVWQVSKGPSRVVFEPESEPYLGGLSDEGKGWSALPSHVLPAPSVYRA